MEQETIQYTICKCERCIRERNKKIQTPSKFEPEFWDQPIIKRETV